MEFSGSGGEAIEKTAGPPAPLAEVTADAVAEQAAVAPETA
jgi:hypothetical protein